jgi:phosphopentomutase
VGKRFDRIFLIVFDSTGVGESPDAEAFGDVGSNTLGHVHEQIGLSVPRLASLGLRRLIDLPDGPVEAAWGKMRERSVGKDTTTGHWEIAGAHLETSFPTFPDGFPPALLAPLEARIGRRALGNKAASGTKVIEELGPEHLATRRPIVYTSADSVLQIACHTDIVPLNTLYAWCEAARALCRGRFEVGRVIARPFSGEPGSFERDQGARRDFSIVPPPGCLTEALTEAGVAVHAVGKIEDIFARVGITSAVHTKDNAEGIERTLEAADSFEAGLVFVNLVDFDSKFGHRNNPAGYANCMEEADAGMVRLMEKLGERDLLVITADHGNDPTTPSTDHSREYVPVLCWWKGLTEERELGERETFADLGQTVAENFGVTVPNGTSFLSALA